MITIGRITRRLTAVAAALTATVMIGSPAQAVGNNAPNLTFGSYVATGTAGVFCDKASRTMTVTESATTMELNGPFGATASAYDAGQWVRFNVWARDVTASSWTQIYTWSPWTYIRTLTSTTYVERLNNPFALGTNRVTGSAGHTYQVAVQIDWWTGKDNIASLTPDYSQVYKTDAYNTYYFNPSKCAF